MVVVEMKLTMERRFHPALLNNPTLIQITGLPGRTVTVTRRLKTAMEADFRVRQRIAAALESHMLLKMPTKQKKAGKSNAVDEEEDTISVGDAMFLHDQMLPGSRGTPCNVIRSCGDGTYEIQLTADFGSSKAVVKKESLSKLQELTPEAAGKNIWHWGERQIHSPNDFDSHAFRCS